MTQHIETAVDDRIATLTINRPEKKNALTGEMYEALSEAIARAEAEPQTRVIVLTGVADVFSSGNDVQDFLTNPPQDGNSPVLRFLRTIAGAGKPIVAAVNGAAVGIGTTLLLHCDIALAAPTARFQLPFTRLALVPEAASSLLLARFIGRRRAAWMMLTGEAIDADTARDWGLINSVVAGTQLAEQTRATALTLAALPPAALRETKALLKRDVAAAIKETMEEESRLFGMRLRSAEAREAMQAFLQRRPADFSRFE